MVLFIEQNISMPKYSHSLRFTLNEYFVLSCKDLTISPIYVFIIVFLAHSHVDHFIWFICNLFLRFPCEVHFINQFFMYGQMGHFRHLFIPFWILLYFDGLILGNLAFITWQSPLTVRSNFGGVYICEEAGIGKLPEKGSNSLWRRTCQLSLILNKQI